MASSSRAPASEAAPPARDSAPVDGAASPARGRSASRREALYHSSDSGPGQHHRDARGRSRSRRRRRSSRRASTRTTTLTPSAWAQLRAAAPALGDTIDTASLATAYKTWSGSVAAASDAFLDKIANAIVVSPLAHPLTFAATPIPIDFQITAADGSQAPPTPDELAFLRTLQTAASAAQSPRAAEPQASSRRDHSAERAFGRHVARAFRSRRNVDQDPSQDSESDDNVSFDLRANLRALGVSSNDIMSISSNRFPPVDRLRRMYRSATRHRKAHPTSVWLSSADLDTQWHPEWVGSHVSHAERKFLREVRAGKPDQFSVLVNNVICFWLSHLSVGYGRVPMILEHICVLSQIAEEKTNAHARRYELTLIDHLRALAKRGDAINLDDYLSTRVASVWNEVSLELVSAVPRPRVPRNPPPDDDSAPHATSKAKPQKTTRPHTGGDRTSTGTDSQPQGGGGLRGRLPPVCFTHDPARNRRCRDNDCTRVHLDTTKPAFRTRYDNAAKAARLRKLARR